MLADNIAHVRAVFVEDGILRGCGVWVINGHLFNCGFCFILGTRAIKFRRRAKSLAFF